MVIVEIQGESYKGDWIPIYSESRVSKYFEMKGGNVFYMLEMFQDLMKYKYFKECAINEMENCESFSEMKKVLNNYDDIIIPDWYDDLAYWYKKLIDISDRKEISLRIYYYHESKPQNVEVQRRQETFALDILAF
jgi:hypothetical protein